MTRWLVTGAGGMLARDVLAVLHRQQDADVTAATRAGLDLTDPDAVADAVARHDVIVNCAAWTAVDDAETHEGAAFDVNATGAAHLARAAATTGAWLVHISTDYVFPGTFPPGTSPAPYPEDAAPAPRTAYGRTKAAGEWAVRAELPHRHWILRTAWLYGQQGPDFVHTMAALERTRDTVGVVTDQHGQPTWTRHVAERIAALPGAAVPPGTYHATSTGHTTWHGLAQAVFTHLGADPARVRPTTSAAYPRPAPRPAWSVLGHDAWTPTGLPPLPPWQDALTEALTTGALLGV